MTRRRLRALAVLAPAVALLVAGSVSLGERAVAAWHPDVESGSPGRLVLHTDRDPSAMIALRADQPAFWMVAAELESGETGTLSLALAKDGPLVSLPTGLHLGVDLCGSEWVGALDPTCPGGARHILDATPTDDFSTISPEWDLGTIAGGDRQFLRVRLALPPESESDPNIATATGTLGLRLTARSLDPSASPITDADTDSDSGVAPVPAGTGEPAALEAPNGLAVTGSDVIALLAAALGLTGVGFGALMVRRDRSIAR